MQLGVKTSLCVAENRVFHAAEQGIVHVFRSDGIEKRMAGDGSGVGMVNPDVVVAVNQVIANGVGCFPARKGSRGQNKNHY